MTHTPGPWNAVDNGPHWNNPTITNWEIQFGDDTECIAEHVYREADARLIAAAPDLLGALKGILAITDRQHVAWDRAHAAIAKAEGKA